MMDQGSKPGHGHRYKTLVTRNFHIKMPFTHVLPPSHPSNLPKSYFFFFKAKLKSLTEMDPNYLYLSVIFFPLSSSSTFSLYTHLALNYIINIMTYIIFCAIDCVTILIHLGSCGKGQYNNSRRTGHR